MEPMKSILALVLLLASCSTASNVITDEFPEAHLELREAVAQIGQDAMEGNLEGLAAAHLNSSKFSKFGPRSFERQGLAVANDSEASFFGSIENLEYQVHDLKIDVLGDVAVVTYYPHVSFTKDGVRNEGSGRQTFVFLDTPSGWKIVHEHGTSKIVD